MLLDRILKILSLYESCIFFKSIPRQFIFLNLMWKFFFYYDSYLLFLHRKDIKVLLVVKVAQSCPTLCDSMDSPGQNTGVGSLSLLQGIFPTQGSNPSLPHCRWILYQLSHKGSPRILEWVAYPFSSGSSRPRNQTGVSCIAGELFNNWAIGEAQLMLYMLIIKCLNKFPSFF